MTYKTPGVFVEEISLLPPSVAEVETAIPAFIGYTETALDDDGNAVSTFPYVKRIQSLLEYEQLFGKTLSEQITVQFNADGLAGADITPSNYLMYYAMQLFYGNGGGPCYIVSVGLQTSGGAISHNDLINLGLGALKKKDEPTMILFPDAINLAMETDYYEVLKQALLQCQNLGDRFAIMDVYNGSNAGSTEYTAFRTGIGNNNLKYGAAYTPFLKTILNYFYHLGTVMLYDLIVDDGGYVPGDEQIIHGKNLAELQGLVQAAELHDEAVKQEGIASAAIAGEEAIASEAATRAAQAAISAANLVIEAFDLSGSTPPVAPNDPATALSEAETALADADTAVLLDAQTAATDAVAAALKARDALLTPLAYADTDIPAVQSLITDEYITQIIQLLALQYLTLPPSSAMAGVYSTVDRTRGVWKAPANVSLNLVSAPSVNITSAEQEDLNVHSTGKSINAIRTFTGKGILVWGARTLAGNDNEWRYVSVRRFFNMAEESIKKATEAFVFEPNDANTWVKVRAMIENFLVLQWRAGALAGATPDEAFFVKVGLGETMTALDILEGRMNVEIGMAVVRPAEFIILKFSHKMQES